MHTKIVKIKQIKKIGIKIVYDLEMPTEHSYIANGFVVHNSVGDGYGKPEYIAEQLRKKGFKGAAITDHGTLGGVWEFQKAMLSKGLKPILGIEAYISIPETDKRFHQTILVKNEKGWKNLLKLHALAVRNNFYYKPIIKVEELFANHEGLIVLGGCVDSPVHKSLATEQDELAESYLKKYKETFGDDYYGEVMLHTAVDGYQSVMEKAVKLYHTHNVKIVFTTDSHYCWAQEKVIHQAITAVAWRKKFDEGGYGDDCFFLLTDINIDSRLNNTKKNQQIEWQKLFIDEWKKNTLEVFDKCNFEYQPTEEKSTLPIFNVAEHKQKIDEKLVQKYHTDKQFNEQEKLFISLVYGGLVKKEFADNKQYQERLQLEITRIIEKQYVNYFLIMWDIMRFCREQKILVGPGRGSAGSSLAAFCMQITHINPIKHKLLFDRFISPIRKDFVDIDCDFQDTRRQEVFEYCKQKYCADNYAKIATYSRWHPKGVLRDMGRIFNIPIAEIEKVCGVVIERCIAGNSKILLNNGEKISIKKLYEKYQKHKKQKNILQNRAQGIAYRIDKKKFIDSVIKNVYYTGEKQMYKIITSSGKTIEASAEHRFFTKQGWKQLQDLKTTDEILTYTKNIDYVQCRICNKILREINTDHLRKHNITKEKYDKKFNHKRVCKEVAKAKGWQKGIPYYGKKLFGKDNPMTNPIHKSKWKKRIMEKERRKKHSEFMKKNNPMYNKKIASKIMCSFAKLFKKGSLPQKKLFNILKKYCKYKVKWEFWVKTKRSFRFIDCAIPDKKIAFEFDGSFWHTNNQGRRDDKKRTKELKQIGWEVISINDNSLSEKIIIKHLKRKKCLKK